MKHDFQPALQPVEIKSLRPTQMTVGLREVARKREQWRSRGDHERPEFLGRHLIPVVMGPDETPFILDNHHLALALRQEGVDQILTRTIADLGDLEASLFWTFMDSRNWLHPFDGDGKRHGHADLPRTVDDLIDDPYRSLAGELRRAGGYAKDETPYSEFLWADFLRRRVDQGLLERDFDGALAKAAALAHRKDAGYLPGWCGVDD